MARTGISKKQVQAAKAALKARQQAVTIDAVRAELGNTGSKTTISRYLNELDQNHQVKMDNLDALSAELGQLIGQVANRLEEEAKERIEQNEARYQNEREQWQTQKQELEDALASAQAQSASLIAQVNELESIGASLREEREQLRISLGQATEKESGLHQRLSERQAHIASLEQKHTHAREALEHFRAATKTQREQDLQRHEHQVQLVQAELRKAQQQVAVVQESLDKAMHNHASLEARLQVTHEQLSSARQNLEKEQQHAAQLKSELTVIQGNLKQKEVVVIAQSEKLAGYKRQVLTQQAEMEQLRHSNIQLSTALKAKETFVEQLLQIKSLTQLTAVQTDRDEGG